MENEQPKALRLANALLEPVVLDKHTMQAADELRRLHKENDRLRQQHLEAHNCTAAIFGALTQISLLTDLGGEVDEYQDVVEAVRRLHKENASM